MAWLEKYWRLTLAIWIAFVFIQALFFKFAGSPEAEHIFGVIGAWLSMPWFAQYGAYLVGGTELIAALVLFTRWRPWGALVSAGVMTGAILFHLLTPLGVIMPAFDESGNIIGDDSGTLFIMACITWNAAVVLVVDDWLSIDSTLGKVFPKGVA